MNLREFAIAYSILDGIPDERIDLSQIASGSDLNKVVEGRLNCSTLACGIGWLAMHPRYRQRGFGLDLDLNGHVCLQHGRKLYMSCEYDVVGAAMLRISRIEAKSIFSARNFEIPFPMHNWREPTRRPKSDKKLLLARMRAFYHRNSDEL